ADIFDAIRCDGVERVDLLLERDPSLARAKNADGKPLISSLHPEMRRLDEMVAVLTKHGVDMNTLDSRVRKTPGPPTDPRAAAWQSAEHALMEGDDATLDRLLREHEQMFKSEQPLSSWRGGLTPNYSGTDARAII